MIKISVHSKNIEILKNSINFDSEKINYNKILIFAGDFNAKFQSKKFLKFV